MRIAMQVRLKQGDIVEALGERGWTQKQGAEFLGLGYEKFNLLVNLQWVPKEFSAELVIKLHGLTGKMVEQLFPEWARQQDFLSMSKVARKMLEVGPHMLNGAGTFHLPPGPQEVFSQNQMKDALHKALQTLSPRNEKILKLLYFEGQSHDEVAKYFDVPVERIRSIQVSALKSLRNKDGLLNTLKDAIM